MKRIKIKKEAAFMLPSVFLWLMFYVVSTTGLLAALPFNGHEAVLILSMIALLVSTIGLKEVTRLRSAVISMISIAASGALFFVECGLLAMALLIGV